MHKELIAVFCPVIIFILSGCATQGVMSLQRLAISQEELKEEVNTQEKFFSVLLDDLKNNRLKNGLSKEEILAKYGEPIYSKPVSGDPEKKEFLLYRHPTNYFSSELVYLYLDQNQRLCSWEIKTP
jgi:hypothetical protein